MHAVTPSFYSRFVCKADGCVHTCCQKWEIDIDDDTAAKYQSWPGKLGDAIRSSMVHSDEGWRIAFNDKGFCPLLTKDGLCRIVKEAGEDGLCEICHAHPRFYTYVDDYELAGVGLCCEASCELLMGETGDLRFDLDGVKTISLPELCEQIGFSISAEDFQFDGKFISSIYKDIIDKLSRTEPIDEDWTNRMVWYGTHEADVLKAFSEREPGRDALFGRILQYILYRRLEDIDYYGTEAVTAFAKGSSAFIYMEALLTGDTGEAMRRWSEQIEYDLDNVDFLLSEPFLFPKDG